jgi:hypothetical protein
VTVAISGTTIEDGLSENRGGGIYSAPGDRGIVAQMEAYRTTESAYGLSLSYSEVVGLYELVSRNEWANDLDVLELDDPAEAALLSKIQLALLPLVIGLGTEAYGEEVRRAWADLADSDG